MLARNSVVIYPQRCSLLVDRTALPPAFAQIARPAVVEINARSNPSPNPVLSPRAAHHQDLTQLSLSDSRPPVFQRLELIPAPRLPVARHDVRGDCQGVVSQCLTGRAQPLGTLYFKLLTKQVEHRSRIHNSRTTATTRIKTQVQPRLQAKPRSMTPRQPIATMLRNNTR